MAKGSDIQERMLKGDISWQEILDITKLNLFINREIGDRKLESSSLHGMGWAYRNLGQYVQSLNFYQKALTLQRELYSEPKQLLLVDLGTVYIDLGQYELALETLQNSLLLKQQACLCHCNALGKIGFVYKELGQYDKALHYLQQALAISDGDSDQQNILNYLGEVYSQIGKYSKALEFYQKALENPPIAGEQSAKGFILNNIGLSHYKRGQYTQGLEVYRKALVLFRELNDRPGERITLSNIGTLLEKQNKPELAIVFYKEAVNITENIRQGLRELPLKEQETYTKSVANTYRSLADLLLSQGRILEAQQVLELLKVQELRNFTRDTRAGGQNSGIATNSTEAEILKIHGTLIALGRKIEQCQQMQCQQKSQLLDQREVIAKQFEATVRSLEQEIRSSRANDKGFLDPSTLVQRGRNNPPV
jgi:tetratricopeptide (TPR) repeat protein